MKNIVNIVARKKFSTEGAGEEGRGWQNSCENNAQQRFLSYFCSDLIQQKNLCSIDKEMLKRVEKLLPRLGWLCSCERLEENKSSELKSLSGGLTCSLGAEKTQFATFA